MLFNVTEIAMATAVACSEGAKIPAYEERIKRLLKSGLIEVHTTESDHPRAARLLTAEEACLASILAFTVEYLNFDIHLQRAIAKAVRRSSASSNPSAGIRAAHDLRRAVEGVADGEKWALSISVRGPLDLIARFVPYDEAYPNDGTEALMEAQGRPLLAKVILGVNDLFEPFARSLRA
ncbi:hypothetical protein [uncultured Erythrobacter sp.]|uniref:hypothetical protein n=1 Tax=uncultured Erythrobacter sp. TaxID=263913 RepID=UPI002616AA27|nr:hypothetical protein [uncultured Erythrobacter sp.]